jgi:hypothetical protein
MYRDDRLIGLATFTAADSQRVSSVFSELPGVLFIAPGLAGGQDAVQIEFDPGRISYEDLLDVLCREQASTTIFWHSQEQAREAATRFAIERAPLFYRH